MPDDRIDLIISMVGSLDKKVDGIVADREEQRVEAAQELGRRPTRTELAMVLGAIVSIGGILSLIGVV